MSFCQSPAIYPHEYLYGEDEQVLGAKTKILLLSLLFSQSLQATQVTCVAESFGGTTVIATLDLEAIQTNSSSQKIKSLAISVETEPYAFEMVQSELMKVYRGDPMANQTIWNSVDYIQEEQTPFLYTPGSAGDEASISIDDERLELDLEASIATIDDELDYSKPIISLKYKSKNYHSEYLGDLNRLFIELYNFERSAGAFSQEKREMIVFDKLHNPIYRFVDPLCGVL